MVIILFNCRASDSPIYVGGTIKMYLGKNSQDQSGRNHILQGVFCQERHKKRWDLFLSKALLLFVSGRTSRRETARSFFNWSKNSIYLFSYFQERNLNIPAFMFCRKWKSIELDYFLFFFFFGTGVNHEQLLGQSPCITAPRVFPPSV